MTKTTTLSEKGFTLVELLIAIIVGSIMVTGLNVMVNAHSSISQRSRNLVLANAYVEGKVESLRSKGYLGLTDGTTDISSELPAELTPPRSSSMQISSPSSGMKSVVVTVTFNDHGTIRSYSYTTYIGELGVGQY